MNQPLHDHKKQVPEVVAWTVDTECPDTTFVVLPDVVTHLTSTVLVVEGGPDAASFEYALESTDTAAAAATDGGGASSASSGTAGGDGGAGSASGGGGGGGSSSASSPAASGGGGEGGGEEAVVWQQGDSSGVIHLHQLEVSCWRVVTGGGGGSDGGYRQRFRHHVM